MSNDSNQGGFLQGGSPFVPNSDQGGQGGIFAATDPSNSGPTNDLSDFADPNGGESFGDGGASFSETTHVSWGEKLMASIVGVGIGFLLVFAMGALLFWNEGRAVQTYRSLNEGAGVIVKADAAKVDPANEGKLVHVQGDLTADAPVSDPALNIQTKAARLVRHVEMYQWKEESRTETKKNLGGSEERTTTYTYTRVWADRRNDSSRFRNQQGHQNPEMRLQGFEATARDAKLGAYRPGQPTLARLSASEAKPIPAGAQISRPELGPIQVSNGELYIGQNPAEPRIGDLRVSYKIAPLGQTAFIGRQSGQDLTEYQTKAGDKLLIGRTGTHSAQEMFADAQAENVMITWILRLVGTIFMFVGFLLILRPIAVLGDVVPFIGSILGAGSALAALVMTMAVAPLVIAIAWFFYRPLVSVGVIVVGGAIFYGLRQLAAKRRASRQGGVFAPGTAPMGAR